MPVGVVISTGRALKTIRVRTPKPFYEPHLRKTFTRYQNLLVHDENEACVEGDVVRVEPHFITSKQKNHMVAEIVSPVRTGEVRKPVETTEEFLARHKMKRLKKLEARSKLHPKDSRILKQLAEARVAPQEDEAQHSVIAA